ncbi:nucleotidyl transferase AbiEii/AbiGii toxin family protein [Sorangium sp. So ce117]|uniref:nucleotidyl transferase AbiEii/AbiGii toxin family protein n=1 Tax=Sorangium sp. So ce117 TaxID=3133277 RepID=UPI003F646F59
MTHLLPRLDILPPAQRALWPELAHIPKRFVLYGGTALALRLGHRESIDFDFFAHDPLDHRVLEREIPWLRDSDALQEEANARTVLVRCPGGSVKVSLFGEIRFGRVGEPTLTEDGIIRVASMLDLAGTKVKALLQRVESKDYLDIAALISAGVAIERVLGSARSLFGPAFNPLIARKTLAYFEGGDLASLPEAVKGLLVEHATSDVEVLPLPKLSERID